MGWDFKNRSDAETLLRMARSGDENAAKSGLRKSGRATILVKAPSGGIDERTSVGATEDARDEYTAGSAECTLLSTYSPSSEVRDQTSIRTVRTPDPSNSGNWPPNGSDDWRDSDMKVYVSNPHPVPIVEGRIFVAYYINGTYVVGDIPDTVLMKTGTGGIAARSGTAAGSASNVKFCHINSSGTIVERATPTLTVYNPFGSAVAADTYITAKIVGDLLVVDAEDCP